MESLQKIKIHYATSGGRKKRSNKDNELIEHKRNMRHEVGGQNMIKKGRELEEGHASLFASFESEDRVLLEEKRTRELQDYLGQGKLYKSNCREFSEDGEHVSTTIYSEFYIQDPLMQASMPNHINICLICLVIYH